jgi:outer membrane protein assembly factor BamB
VPLAVVRPREYVARREQRCAPCRWPNTSAPLGVQALDRVCDADAVGSKGVPVVHHGRRIVGRPLRLAVSAAMVVGLAGCWPVPGAGPDRSSHNPLETSLTVANVATLEQAFRAPVPDAAGPPVVTGRGLFVSSRLRVHAFDRHTGDPVWEQMLGRLYSDDPESFPDSVASVSDPYVDGAELLVTDAQYRGSGSFSHRLSRLSTATGAVGAQSVASGTLLAYRAPRIATSASFALIPGQSFLRVDDLAAGTSWGGFSPSPTTVEATLGTDRLYTAAGDAVRSFDLTVPCELSPDGLSVDVCQPTWSTTLDGDATAVVLTPDRTTAFVASSAGTAYALDAATGAVRWSLRLGSAALAAPALADGTLYVATIDGRVVAGPAAGCGALRCRPAWRSGKGPAIEVQPAVGGGVVYVGAVDGSVRAFDAAGCGAARCRPLWARAAGDPVAGGLAVALGRLYVGTATGVVAFEPTVPTTPTGRG